MLIAAVIHLKAYQSGQIRGSNGRAVHGFWFQQWQTHQPAIANALHKSQTIPPFTLSPIMGLPLPLRGSITVAADASAWLRITTFDQALAQPFLEIWLAQLPPQITIMGIPWSVSGVALNADEHPWAGCTTYQSLLDRQLGVLRQPPKWTLQFETPTAFHASTGNNYLPFPLPDALVGSWLRRWQAYSPHPLQIDLRQRLRDDLLVSAYNLKTVSFRNGRKLSIGCVGDLTLRAGKLDEEECALLSILTTYAFYTGSGHHTAQGMGMTRKK